jgi:hypothetical protein
MAFNLPRREVLLSSQTASSNASIAFTSVITANFSTYLVKIRDMVPQTNSTALWLTFSTDNGATYLSANYKYGGFFNNDAAATGTSGSSNSAAQIVLFGAIASNVSSSGWSADVMLYDMNASATCLPKVSTNIVYYSSAPNANITRSSGMNTAGLITAVKFAMSSGNIVSGTFRIYGLYEA